MKSTEPAPGPISPGQAYDLGSAAKRLSLSRSTLARQIKIGKIRAVSVSQRRKAIPGAELIRLLSA